MAYESMVIHLPPNVQKPGRDSVYLAELSRALPGSTALVVGCGSGLLALELASQERDVVALDINADAVECCTQNASVNGLAHRVTGVVGDVRDIFAEINKFDIVLSNPPQLPTVEARPQDDSWITHANDGGVDGLDMIRWLCEHSIELLNDEGCLGMVHFDFLDLEGTVEDLNGRGYAVSVDDGIEKRLGTVSRERLFNLGYSLDSYWARIVLARKTSKDGNDDRARA